MTLPTVCGGVVCAAWVRHKPGDIGSCTLGWDWTCHIVASELAHKTVRQVCILGVSRLVTLCNSILWQCPYPCVQKTAAAPVVTLVLAVKQSQDSLTTTLLFARLLQASHHLSCIHRSSFLQGNYTHNSPDSPTPSNVASESFLPASPLHEMMHHVVQVTRDPTCLTWGLQAVSAQPLSRGPPPRIHMLPAQAGTDHVVRRRATLH